jgi:DMSO/TMAO reductase YedYZ molybdopterin-dependent catalytic subunit
LAAATIIVALGASTYYLSATQTQSLVPSGNPPQTQLKISGDVALEKSLTIADLTKMPQTKVAATVKGETATFSGVSMLELLSQTGASWDAGYINVKAADYNVTISTYQAYNSTTQNNLTQKPQPIILAFAKNGKWITDSQGPLELIASGYNVKNVNEINLQPWTINLTGAVSNPTTLTSSKLSSYGEKTVTGPFKPGDGDLRTSDWTGVSLWSILQASGIQTGATKVSVTAIDGYTRTFTVGQVQEAGMLVGYKENGAYIARGEGLPYRLMIPTDDLKWGQDWVKWVAQISVS